MDLHAITKITLRSTNFERTRRFYGELFNWKFHQYTETYLGFEPPAGISGGFQKVMSFNPGDSVLLYITVNEFEPYLNLIRKLGGMSEGEVEPVFGLGAYVRFFDPDGNRLALWREENQAGLNADARDS